MEFRICNKQKEHVVYINQSIMHWVVFDASQLTMFAWRGRIKATSTQLALLWCCTLQFSITGVILWQGFYVKGNVNKKEHPCLFCMCLFLDGKKNEVGKIYIWLSIQMYSFFNLWILHIKYVLRSFWTINFKQKYENMAFKFLF